jgi:hypothetical protein
VSRPGNDQIQLALFADDVTALIRPFLERTVF